MAKLWTIAALGEIILKLLMLIAVLILSMIALVLVVAFIAIIIAAISKLRDIDRSTNDDDFGQ